MTLSAAWSIKGIDPETREKVKIQAKAAGLTMGEWLSGAVNTATQEDLSPINPNTHYNRINNVSMPQHGYKTQAEQQISGGFNIIESALSDIVGHIELADKNNSSALRNMQAQIAHLNNRTKAQNPPAARSIHKEFDQMENRLSTLANRIDELNSHTTPVANPTQDKQPNHDQFNQSEMLSRFDELFIKLDNLNHQQSDYGNNIKYLEEGMQGQLDSISNSLSDNLNAKNNSYDSEFDVMENRFADLSERLDNSINVPKIDPQIAELEEQVNSLTDKLSTFLSNQKQKPNTEITELKDSIANINTRLDKTEERLSGVDRIEENMSKLISSVEDIRNNNHKIAKEAANEALTSFSKAQEKQEKTTDNNDAINKLIADKFSEFSALNSENKKEDLSEYKNVQSSLDTIMNRLSKVEDNRAERFSQPISSETSPPDRPDYRGQEPMAVQDFIQPGAEKIAEQPQDIPATTADKPTKNTHSEPSSNPKIIATDISETPKVMATATQDKPQVHPSATADIPMQSVPIGSEQTEKRPVSRPNKSTDFIAAARRAAQQAYNEDDNNTKDNVKKSLFSKIKRKSKKPADNDAKTPVLKLDEVVVDESPKKQKFSLSKFNFKKKQNQKAPAATITKEEITEFPEGVFENNFITDIEIPAQNIGNELEVEDNKDTSKPSWLKQQITPPVIISLIIIVIIIAATSLYSSLKQPNNTAQPVAQNAPIENTQQPEASVTNSPTAVVHNARQILNDAQTGLATQKQGDTQGEFIPAELLALPSPSNDTRQPTVKQLETLNNANPLVTNSITSFAKKSYDDDLLNNNKALSNSTSLKQRKQPTSKPLPRIIPSVVSMDVELPPKIGPKLLRQNALAGLAAEQFEIANRYALGNGVDVDLEKSFDWFLRAANNNLAPAQFSVGMMLENGKGTNRDLATAKQYYQQAADQGNLMSVYRLAMINAAPRNPALKPDFKASLKWFNIAANAGLVDAQYNLAVLYEKGQGAKTDLVEAYKWYTLAGKEGDKQAAKRADTIKLDLSPAQIVTAQNNVKQWTLNKLPSKANIVPPLSYLKNEPTPEITQISASKYITDGVLATDITADEKTIISAQKMLKMLGWNIGTADGVLGTKTRKAITEFQTRQNLTITGKVDDELIANLEGATL